MISTFLNKLAVIYDQLQSELDNAITKSHYRYILLDKLGIVSELSLIYELALQDNIAPELLAVIKRPELAHNENSCPLLVCIAEPNEPLNEELLLSSLAQIKEDYLTSKHYVCGFIASPLTPEALAEALLESGIRAGRALGKPFLPFYEPFTLDILHHSYQQPESHLGLILPPDTCYCFINTDVEACFFQSVSYQDEQDFTLRFVNETLRYYQLNQMALYGLAVTWLELCEQQNKDLPAKALATIIDYFYDAYAMQLTNAKDRRAYVLFSLQYGQLTANKRLLQLINDVIANEEKHGQLGLLLSQQEADLNALNQNIEKTSKY